jgi:hypothetical protein
MPVPSPEAENRRDAYLANPFWVLELPPTAGYVEAERQGAKLLAMIAAAVSGAESYRTPLGRQLRTADLVRQSLAEIRDPDRRCVHEWWARGMAE